MPDNLKAASSSPEDFTPAVIQEWLPESLMACFVVGIVERLDLSKLESHYGDDRKQAANLRILLALLFHGYTSGIFSSRELERASYDSEAFRFITANTHPGHVLISSFRKRFLRELEGLFVQIMIVARTMGLVSKDEENLDGNKLKERLRNQAASLLIRAEKADARDRQQGVDRAGTAPGRAPETGQTQAPSTEINEDMLNDPYSTYTFLSKRGAVQAQASRKSRSYIIPWAIVRRPVLVARTLAAALFRTRPQRQRRRPVLAYKLLFLVVLSGTLLLTHYYYQDDLAQPGTGRPAGGSAVIRRQPQPDTGVPEAQHPVHRTSNAGAINKPARREQQAAPGRIVVATLLDKQPAATGRRAGLPELSDAPATPTAAAPVASGTPDTEAPATAHTVPVPPDTPGKPANRTADDTAAASPAGLADDRPAPAGDGTGVVALAEAAAAGRQAARGARNRDQAGTPHREDWLLDQAGGHYMLQLLGTRFEDALLEFIQQHKPDGPLAYYRGIYKGKNWYVLLYGDFPSNQAAIDAIETLPKNIRANRPWPRTLRSIQAAILEARIR